jgi:hypothetical protein
MHMQDNRFKALTHLALRNRIWGRIRGSICLATSAAQQIRHLPCAQTAHNLGVTQKDCGLIHPKRVADQAQSVIDATIDLIGRETQKAGGDFRKQPFEAQLIFKVNVPDMLQCLAGVKGHS